MLSFLEATNIGTAKNKMGTQMHHHSTDEIRYGLN